ncbi:Eco57I restriction-modification methylase domain-containing protein [Flammeovirga sp. SubArs3]|uniref:Eco57I restriction-modification methylase domain-containing protein n=1 Tax=Flammeovirga sp. SubArs3 TaxID=2995316 RepID=UPI00248B3B4D|nr:Eco57I restriction-modification methylase domain-containing protein [Flammeovirga sp. SubArs3]
MEKDRKISELTDYPDSNYVFPGVEVKGGISYLLWDNNHNDKCKVTTIRGNDISGPHERYLDDFDILVRDSRAVKILNKVLSINSTSITTILSVDKEFGWTSNFDGFNKNEINGYIPLYYIKKADRRVGWIEREKIFKSPNLVDTYKVLIPKAGSDGGKKIPDIVLGKPMTVKTPSVCTQSFLFFYLDTEEKAISLEKYLRTKFFRFLVSLRKMTQDATKSSYQWVPIQDFTSNSDIDWNKSIDEINNILYQKYNLTSEDISYIEKMIKPMKS